MAHKTQKQDQELMRILKVHEISRIICDTDMGTLKLRIRKGEQDYQFVLDSVELPRELHKEIYELLYAPEIPQVKYEAVNMLTEEQWKKLNPGVEVGTGQVFNKKAKLDTGIVVDLKKKGGRPIGSKNKK